ncbi:hypothetical protein HWV62_42709 [Athelia sp. TMB]|nr:hypothetical protein HWV62_42709 [Athelia sp. TMB]
MLTYMYYGSYPNDWKVHRIAVGALWLLDTLHLVFSIMLGYHYLVSSFGNPLALEFIHWSLKAQIGVNVVIIVIVQCLYAVRMWRLVGIVLAFFMLQPDVFEDLAGWTVIGSFAATTVTDIVIAAFMCFYLYKSKTGFATILLAQASPLVYINSFLAMLNARRSINGHGDTSAGAGLSVELQSTPHARIPPTHEIVGTKQHLQNISIGHFPYPGEGKSAISWSEEP